MLSANIISWGLGWYVIVETPLMAVCCCYCIIRIIYSTYIDHVGSDWQAVFPNCNDVKHHNYTPQRHWLLLWTVSHSNKHSLNPVENFRSADINSSVEHKPYILIESFFFVTICTQGQAFPGTTGLFQTLASREHKLNQIQCLSERRTFWGRLVGGGICLTVDFNQYLTQKLEQFKRFFLEDYILLKTRGDNTIISFLKFPPKNPPLL